ncbi:hypothetical protein ABFU82_08660 [Nocardioides sp. WV_118_6]
MNHLGRISGARAIAPVLVLLLVTGALAVAAAPARAEPAGTTECEPSARVTAVEGAEGFATLVVQGIRYRVRKAGRVFKVRATATVGISARAWFDVTGTIDRCTDGVSSPEVVATRTEQATMRTLRLTSVAKHRKKAAAIESARKGAKRAVRRDSWDLVFVELDAAARAQAPAELSKLLVVEPT